MSGEHLHIEYALDGHDHPADPHEHPHTHPAVAHDHPHTHPEIAALSATVARLSAEVAALKPAPVVEYAYLGKPETVQTVGRSYTRLDQSFYDPEAVGWEHTLYYLNVDPTFRAGFVGGAIRPRLVRADGDMTAYNDIEIHADCLDGNGKALKTGLYWEAGDGNSSYLELQCIGGLASATISTRYTKKAVVPK